MIKSFKDNKTKSIFDGIRVKSPSNEIQVIARRKLVMINASADFRDLKIPPSNQLEKLSGNRKGQYSIRINKQWRICFEWKSGNAYKVEITDYH